MCLTVILCWNAVHATLYSDVNVAHVRPQVAYIAGIVCTTQYYDEPYKVLCCNSLILIL